jgi:hypothetical protein
MSRPRFRSLGVIRSIVAALVLAASASVASGVAQVPSTSVTFKIPAGFTALAPDEIAAKFPSRNAPRTVVGNARRTTTIAYDVREAAVTDELLETQLSEISALSARGVPGFQPIDQGMRTINQRRWAYLEFRSTAADADIRNIVMMCAYDGRLVVLNFNATESDFATLEPMLRTSIASLSAEPDMEH